MKKSLSILFVLAAIFCCNKAAGQSGGPVTDLILKSYSARTFTSEAVSDQDLNIILKCGIKAPSSRNGQPWKFTVVRDTARTKPIIGNINQGNVLILVSGPEGQASDFDCALATENMNIAAQSLGLGARIYGGPVRSVNSTMKEKLQIPAGFSVVTILRIGHIENNADAISAASTRKNFEDIVNFR
jgi:nitroreductase